MSGVRYLTRQESKVEVTYVPVNEYRGRQSSEQPYQPKNSIPVQESNKGKAHSKSNERTIDDRLTKPTELSGKQALELQFVGFDHIKKH